MTAAHVLIDRLTAKLDPKSWTIDPDLMAAHLVEWRGRYHGASPLLALPASTDEVSMIVGLCAEAGVAITPQGGNTGLVGAQIPAGEILISLRRLNKIRSVSPDDDALTAEAGVVLTAVHEAAAGANRHFPLSLASQGSATIGGLISTNAGGVHVVRFGMMRDLVLGLEVVLPDGRVLPALKSLRKDNTGYDLKQLFIGAEGTLGVVTAATLKLYPKPAEHVVAVAAVPGPEAALRLLHHVKGRTGALAAFELMNRLSIDLVLKNIPGARDPLPGSRDWLTLIELETVRPAALKDAAEQVLGEAIEQGFALDAVISESHAQARDFWNLRELMAAAHRVENDFCNLDISAPVSCVPAFLRESENIVRQIDPGARIVAFGHAGDGNIHYTILHAVGVEPAAANRLAPRLIEAVQDIAVGMGGSISAEHGIGVTRRDELQRYKDQVSLDVMAKVKAAIDPKRIMNPRALT